MDKLRAALLRHEAIEINFGLHPRTVCVEVVVDGNERHVEREVAFDERRDLAAADLRGDERTRAHAPSQLE